jgi:lactoylglutathione lyase
LSWINLRLPDSEDYIELMLFKSAPAEDKRGTAHHLCLETPDIDASMAAINANPARAGYTRPIDVHLGKNRKRQANLFDPDGTRTELMEPRTIDGKPTPPSTAPLPDR